MAEIQASAHGAYTPAGKNRASERRVVVSIRVGALAAPNLLSEPRLELTLAAVDSRRDRLPARRRSPAHLRGGFEDTQRKGPKTVTSRSARDSPTPDALIVPSLPFRQAQRRCIAYSSENCRRSSSSQGGTCEREGRQEAVQGQLCVEVEMLMDARLPKLGHALW
ncbi:hypothetical protein NMY22_g7800 [Coprinellus aureogranulatus]|nr:hypothetical protein NMY22_g7800 [Coprinellus aureogranulatus]